MSLLANSNAIESGGYPIQRSLRFRSSASAYLNRTFTTPTNNKIWTFNTWLKRGQLSVYQHIFDSSAASGQEDYIRFTNGDILQFSIAAQATSLLNTSQVFRDPSAFYMLTLAVDTTQATAANRVKLYINGTQVTAFSTANYPAQNAATYINSAVAHNIGCYGGGGGARSYFYDGYLTETVFVDGQQLTPSSFGQTDPVTGVWQPLKYMGTYGTNGFYLPFSDNTSATTLVYDKSGNGNNWTANNISTTSGATYDSMTDVPTLTSATAANYCVLNPLQTTQSATAPTNGNLTSPANSGVWRRIGATMQIPSSGKFYFEYTCDSFASFPTFNIGVFSGSLDTTNNAIGYSATEWGYNAQSGYATNNNTNITSGFTTATTGDILQLAYDASTGSIWFGKNNSWQGASSPNPATGTSPTYTGVYNITPVMIQNWATQSANFGQRPFSYTPPTGFVALNTYNLPTPTILAGNKYMDATLYSGTSASQSVTNAGSFQPDLVWIKSRSAATDHKLTDSVRGVTKALISDTTGAETTDTNGLTAFNSNGFTVGSDSVYNNGTGPATYVGWQWQAGKGTTSSNTSGSITSTVSVNTTAGFSVVTYTGTGANATVGHGLGVAPKMVIVKCRSSAGTSWLVQHYFAGVGYLILNTTDAYNGADTTAFNGTFPTSSVFSVGTGLSSNTATYVAYLFAEIPGFSKFGSYTGNGSTDGPFVYCGFRPKYILRKRTDSTSNWLAMDSVRGPYNVDTAGLYPNTSDAEDNGPAVDLLSNGFKVRGTGSAENINNATYIFAAFAESPFKFANAR